MPDELNERPDGNIDAWVAENGNTTDETMADLVESAIVPHIVKYGGGPNGEQRALFILDGAGSDKVEGGLFFAACARNNIDVAIIPASCTDEIQLMDVVVNAKFKNSLYYKWAMWMMNGPRKVQPKSGNYVMADFTTILDWCAYAWDSVKTETIVSGVEKCCMSSNPGKEFEVEPEPEKMKIEDEAKAKKDKKKIQVRKSKSPAEMKRFKMKIERARKRLERAKKPKKSKKATPKKQNRRTTPKKRMVRRRKTQRKKKN